jgi:predicted RNA binding protein YcfA (HicA-like mRNA interferase family)
MPRKAKDVSANLVRKGFRRHEGDHAFFRLYVGGKKTRVSTKISHGEKDIPDGLLAHMARDTRLNRAEFLELVDCPMTEESYLNLLRSRGHL